jgi:hypothetical protein
MSILLNDSFRDDPAMRYGLGALPEAEQEAYRQQFLRVLFKAAALNGGSFHFARDDKSCGGIWVPPGKKMYVFLRLSRFHSFNRGHGAPV